MVRILFLFIILLNIVFFSWEYRKGAPGIYLPPNYEANAGSNIGEHKIVLNNERPEAHEQESKIDDKQNDLIQQQKIKPVKKPSNNALKPRLKQNVATSKAASQTSNKELLISSAADSTNKVSDSRRIQAKPTSKTTASLTEKGAVDANARAHPEILKANNVIVQAPAKEIFPPLAQANPASENSIPIVEQNVIGISNNTETEQILFKTQQLKLEAFSAVEVEGQSAARKPGNSINIDNPPIVACYRLQQGDYTQETFAQSSQKAGLKLKISELNKKSITSYLVLTVKSKSFEDAEKLKQKIKQQGINDLWLFKQGGFTGRISLGLYSSEEKAGQAKQAFAKQTDQTLEIVASYQTSIIQQIKISVRNKQGIVDFQRQYATIIGQKISCAEINSYGALGR